MFLFELRSEADTNMELYKQIIGGDTKGNLGL